MQTQYYFYECSINMTDFPGIKVHVTDFPVIKMHVTDFPVVKVHVGETHVRSKIYQEFHHGIVYIANEGGHIRIKK
jgi:hypothetical protein